MDTAQLAKQYFSQVLKFGWVGLASRFFPRSILFIHVRLARFLFPLGSHLNWFQLERPLVRELYQQYRIDFDMFGYSPQLYINLAKIATEVKSVQLENP